MRCVTEINVTLFCEGIHVCDRIVGQEAYLCGSGRPSWLKSNQ